MKNVLQMKNIEGFSPGLVTPAYWCLWFGVLFLFTLPGALLQLVGWHYSTLGGSGFEKIHPSSMLLFLGLSIQIFSGKFVVFDNKKIVDSTVTYFLCLIVSILYCGVFLKKPVAVFVDTWLTPGAYALLWVKSNYCQRSALQTLVYALLFLNFSLGILEFFFGFRLVPLVLVDINNLEEVLDVSEWSEWRSTALLNHPLIASLVAALFFFIHLAITLKEGLNKFRIVMLLLALISMLVFGGRASLGVTLIFSLALIFEVLFSRSDPNSSATSTAFGVVFFVIFFGIVSWSLGVIDPFLAKMDDDNGSAEARWIVFDVLSDLSVKELFFGDLNGSIIYRLIDFGLMYGVEISWLNMVFNFGIIITIVVLLGFFRVTRDFCASSFFVNPFWVLLMFFVICSTGVYFSSKTLVVTQFYVLLSVFILFKPVGNCRFK